MCNQSTEAGPLADRGPFDVMVGHTWLRFVGESFVSDVHRPLEHATLG